MLKYVLILYVRYVGYVRNVPLRNVRFPYTSVFATYRYPGNIISQQHTVNFTTLSLTCQWQQCTLWIAQCAYYILHSVLYTLYTSTQCNVHSTWYRMYTVDGREFSSLVVQLNKAFKTLFVPS